MDLNIDHKKLLEPIKNYCYCLLCFADKSSAPEDETFVNINSEGGDHRNIGTLVHKYFIEENLSLEGFVCGSCCQQLENFHSFYLRIKELQWSKKMHTTEESSLEKQAERTDLELNIKEEKTDEGYNFDHTGDVDGFSNFLNEQFKTHDADNNGNGLQNRLLDSFVNEFQASSLGGTESLDCGIDQPFSKRIKRNLTNTWHNNQLNNHLLSNTPNPDIDFLEEEYYEYDKPPDEHSDPAPSTSAISPLEELERLKRENNCLKRHNHQLVVRLKEVRMRNSDLVKVNKELTDKIRSYNPNTLPKAVPSISDHLNIYQINPPTVNSKPLTISPAPSVNAPVKIPSQPQHHKIDKNASRHAINSGAYTLDNGDVVVRDSVIPSTVMMEIDSVEQGEKYDLKFISKLAVALWGHERLAISSVTGRRSNNAGRNATPCIQLEPEKLSFIKEKVYDRAMRETNDRVQAMARFDDSRINRLLNIKIQNAKRKKNFHSNAV